MYLLTAFYIKRQTGGAYSSILRIVDMCVNHAGTTAGLSFPLKSCKTSFRLMHCECTADGSGAAAATKTARAILAAP
jgi:1-aminocyclopropane-1-carboxylate deaminase/D-cysteine desulfhydrase-like pyridoxal-dependent ACC family enzyme